MTTVSIASSDLTSIAIRYDDELLIDRADRQPNGWQERDGHGQNHHDHGPITGGSVGSNAGNLGVRGLNSAGSHNYHTQSARFNNQFPRHTSRRGHPRNNYGAPPKSYKPRPSYGAPRPHYKPKPSYGWALKPRLFFLYNVFYCLEFHFQANSTFHFY